MNLKGQFEEVCNYFYRMWGDVDISSVEDIREFRVTGELSAAIFRFELYEEDDEIRFILFPYERDKGWHTLMGFTPASRWSVEHMNQAVNRIMEGMYKILNAR